MTTATFPTIKGTTKEELKKLVHFLNTAVQRVRWDNERLTREFGNRTGEQILQDGTTHYMGPCLDLSLAALTILHYHNLPGDLLVESFLQNDTYNLHFVLQFGTTHYLDFVRDNKAVTAHGIYPGNQRGDIILQLGRIAPSLIQPNKTLRTILEEPTTAPKQSFREDILKRYQQEPHIKRLCNSNTEERYQGWQQGITQELKLTTK